MTSRLATTLAALSLIALTPAGAQISVVPLVHSPLALGTASIDGRVLTDAGTPAGGATVTLRQPIERFVDSDGPHYEPRTTTTDADGKFSFEKLGSEVVEIVASTSGAPDVVYGQTRPGLPGTPLRLSEGQRLSVTLRFARASLITGTVFDTAGAPAAGIKVFAFRTLPLSEGESLMAEGADTMANVRGEYRLSGLTSGRFVVMAYRDRGRSGARRSDRRWRIRRRDRGHLSRRCRCECRRANRSASWRRAIRDRSPPSHGAGDDN